MKRHHRELVEKAWEVMETAQRLNKKIKFIAGGWFEVDGSIFDDLEEVEAYFLGVMEGKISTKKENLCCGQN